MDLHRLLQRQLDKSKLNLETPPESLEQWTTFVAYVNKSYLEGDQERYLTERSMKISSQELIEINERLEAAQYLAGLCYWHYSFVNHLLIWSKGINPLLHAHAILSPPTIKEFLNLIHPEDLPLLKLHFKKSLLKKINCDFEMRIKTFNNNYECFRIIIKPDEKEKEFSGILLNINAIKESEAKIKELNRALLSTARLAGMSEVATTILHNIGNILNSANVSINVLKEHLFIINSERFNKIIAMIQEPEDFNLYFTTDPKGKLIIHYLETISETLEKIQQINNAELIRLEKNFTHIRDIVAMQKTISGVLGVSEKVSISDLLDNALEMANIQGSMLKITKEISADSNTIITDRSKILQILTNLLRNAKQAVLEDPHQKLKQIHIRVKKINETINIQVRDNGIGVPEEHLKQIFSFGFTTKPNGHGFGLHSSALSAKELGGTLDMCSKGVGKGAEFTLVLPCILQKRNLRRTT
jgi:signal transduction histidine kinase